MKQQKTVNAQLYRQGDVLFQRIAALPDGTRKKRANATVAYGEVTGHSHALAVEDRDVAEVFEIGDGLYVHVTDRGVRIEHKETEIRADAPAASMSEVLSRTMREAHLPIREIAEGRANASGFVSMNGATFVHEEHGPVTLPPGDYKVVIQREYSPEAIRNVAD